MYSEGPYADYGGDMGWVEEGKLMDKIDDIIFRMDKDELSGIVETKLGFHMFKVEDRQPGETKDFAEVKKRIEALLFNRKKGKKSGRKLRKLIKDPKKLRRKLRHQIKKEVRAYEDG